jgi:hypothetical protein
MLDHIEQSLSPDVAAKAHTLLEATAPAAKVSSERYDLHPFRESRDHIDLLNKVHCTVFVDNLTPIQQASQKVNPSPDTEGIEVLNCLKINHDLLPKLWQAIAQDFGSPIIHGS